MSRSLYRIFLLDLLGNVLDMFGDWIHWCGSHYDCTHVCDLIADADPTEVFLRCYDWWKEQTDHRLPSGMWQIIFCQQVYLWDICFCCTIMFNTMQGFYKSAVRIFLFCSSSLSRNFFLVNVKLYRFDKIPKEMNDIHISMTVSLITKGDVG